MFKLEEEKIIKASYTKSRIITFDTKHDALHNYFEEYKG